MLQWTMSSKKPEELLDFVTSLAGEEVLKVEEDLGSGFYKLNIGEAERRQARQDIRSIEDAVVELVRNSRDAGATRIFVATSKDNNGLRRITVLDDGRGVPHEFHEAIFEPRVTSKVDGVIEDRFGIHGRGMALYSIRSNTDELGLLESEPGRGTALTMSVAVSRLRERKDQSTFPKLKVTAANKIKIVSGPHNVWRHLVEISLDSPDVEIFYGSHSEILAVLISDKEALSPDQSAIWSDLALLDDPDDLSERGASLGLRSSARSCRRIRDGGIEPAHSIKCRLRQVLVQAPAAKVSRRRPAGRISKEDLEELAKVVTEDFRRVGSKYFLRVKGEPKISSSPTKVTIELLVESDDSW